MARVSVLSFGSASFYMHEITIIAINMMAQHITFSKAKINFY